MPHLETLRGLWRRSLIIRPDGTQDSTTSVHWLQAGRIFADLRQPAGLPPCHHARTLAALTRADCLVLAAQEGFAGNLGYDGAHFEWTRLIDYQPSSGVADAGALYWEAGTLVETGRDADYREHWHRDETAPAHPVAALMLRHAETGTPGALIRVGDDFMFASARIAALALPSLSACVAAAETLAQAQAMVNCEISHGKALPTGLRITASTLPFRVGVNLQPTLRGNRLSTGGGDASLWEITAAEGAMDVFIATS